MTFGSTVATPFIGGLLISAATTLNLYYKGRITGMSGIFFNVVSANLFKIHYSLAIIVGLVLSSTIAWEKYGYGDSYRDTYLFDAPQVFISGLSLVGWVISGFLVGLGTKLANGCTSGHGVCGIPRFSGRSIVAVVVFMVAAMGVATLRYNKPFLDQTVWAYEVARQDTDLNSHIALAAAIAVLVVLCFTNVLGKDGLKDIFVSVAVGFIFGCGLIVSGMTKRTRVLGFLTINDGWDPALAFVMGGAVLGNLITFWYLLRIKGSPKHGSFDVPSDTKIDTKLIAGAAIFGAGWGLCGICPGPALTIFPFYFPHVIALFIPAMAGGQLLGGYIDDKWSPSGGFQLFD